MPFAKEEYLYGVNPYQNLAKIINDISALKAIDCILVTGDIAHKGEYESYLLVGELYRNIDVPAYWLQGNHDYSEVMLQVANQVKIKSDKSLINSSLFGKTFFKSAETWPDTHSAHLLSSIGELL